MITGGGGGPAAGAAAHRRGHRARPGQIHRQCECGHDFPPSPMSAGMSLIESRLMGSGLPGHRISAGRPGWRRDSSLAKRAMVASAAAVPRSWASCSRSAARAVAAERARSCGGGAHRGIFVLVGDPVEVRRRQRAGLVAAKSGMRATTSRTRPRGRHRRRAACACGPCELHRAGVRSPRPKKRATIGCASRMRFSSSRRRRRPRRGRGSGRGGRISLNRAGKPWRQAREAGRSSLFAPAARRAVQLPGARRR